MLLRCGRLVLAYGLVVDMLMSYCMQLLIVFVDLIPEKLSH